MADQAEALLKEYRKKRDFSQTQEPSGGESKAGHQQALSFVIQKHDATRLHYDFRLELDGVLMSWAVTRGPSLNPKDKRLAVHVEDHPLDYGSFEGTIPKGQYGGGTVMLWDQGTWEPIGDPHEGMARGDLKFRVHGKRMKGEWVLVHMKGRDTKSKSGTHENWLLIKHHDGLESDTEDLTEKFTTSVTTGRDLDGIAKGLKPKRRAAAKSADAAEEEPAATQVWSGGKAVALPEFRAPELATLVDAIPPGREWLFEMKYDGYRALAAVASDQVRIYTRNANDWTTQFGRMVEPLSKLTKGSALLDGEICAFREGKTDFSTLKTALGKGEPLTYFVFDILEQDGEDLTSLPLIERKERLKALIGETNPESPIQYSEHVVGNGEKVFKAMCEAGHEGVLAKLARSPYRGDRTRDWLKIKCIQRQEFVIGGWRPSEKKRTFASLLLGTWEDGKLVYRGRVGTGWNADDAESLQAALDARARDASPFSNAPRDIARQAKWVEPELVGEIAYTEITPDNVLRHPSFIGLREDKKSREVKFEKPVEVEEAKSESAPTEATKPRRKTAAAKAPKVLKPVELTDEMGIAAAEKNGLRLTHPERVVFPEQNVTKAEIVAYYEAVAERMLPHIVHRPLSLVRCPQGRSKYCFFQKHESGGFPEQFHKVAITEKDGDVQDYMYVEGVDGIIAGVQMNSLEFHIWGSHIEDVDHADRIIFDIDPDEGLGFEHVKSAARDFRDKLQEMGIKTYPMATGGKGIHVIAPLTPTMDWIGIKTFCRAFAEKVAKEEPDRFTANIRKVNRKGRMFVDYLRNERGSTAIAPFSTRSRDGAPCAVPVSWEELETLDRANGFSLGEAAARARAPDPWLDYFEQKQAITPEMMKAVGA